MKQEWTYPTTTKMTEKRETKKCIVTCYHRGIKWSIVTLNIQNLEMMNSVQRIHILVRSVLCMICMKYIHFIQKVGRGVYCSGRKLARAHCVFPLGVNVLWRVLWFTHIVSSLFGAIVL